MTDPFYFRDAARVSFSGGRTSAYMLWRILRAHGGTLPRHVHVTFANTGKERPETLDFVHEVETRWGVNVRWLEYAPTERRLGPMRYREVTYATAARQGEPFRAMIAQERYVPNSRRRICTKNLKIGVFKAFSRAHAIAHAVSVVGLRADEPDRVARMRAGATVTDEELAFPLFETGVAKADVAAFWAAQPFDLQLEEGAGNCDLCFLKGAKLRVSLMEKWPEAATWWADIEREFGHPFRAGRPGYAELAERAKTRRSLPQVFDDEESLGDCVCHD